ncbi:MAG: DEAD/DEAH box helicase [Planctomycetia bacterium]|nr:DEAD/DEAH box helicase [Planctomycetia bacterium]MBL6914075.1 DEAD/DEAH box helicase [Planctomycetota bacterium]
MNQNPNSDASIYDADKAISSTSGFTVNSVQRKGSAPTPLEVLHGVEARMGSAEELVSRYAIPARDAEFAQTTPDLDPQIIDHLKASGTWPLYRHQARSLTKSLSGEDVVIASSTASGKTLCCTLPVIDAMVKEPGAHALLLYPTKALSQDQHRHLRGLIDGIGLSLETGIYDGDTEPTLRRRLRRSGRIILTNPDMLHASVLPNHGGWGAFFANLRYVVIDEVHTLRGIFGSHVASVLRRLRRICRHHGSDPTFIAASATIQNPGEHVSRLIGRDVKVIEDDGSPRGHKEVVLWNPPVIEKPDGTLARRGPTSVAVKLLPELVRRGLRTICFARTRNSVELILRYIRERAKGARDREEVADRIEPYRAGYLPSERRQTEASLFDGQLGGVVSTSALEVGIDVGGLDGCIIVGWPGSVCSFMQQAGRAGRRQGESLVFLIAGQDPIDQWFVRHPDSLHESSPENAVIETDNPYIVARHLICAAYELPLSGEDSDLLGEDLTAMCTVLQEEKRLREEGGAWYLAREEYPATQVKLRTASEENFTILELGPENVIGELDYVAAMLSLYEGAIYIHRAETFIVEEMDHVNCLVKIRRTKTGYYTQVLTQKKVTVTEEWSHREVPGAGSRLAEVEVRTRLTGYKKVRFHSTENIGYGEVHLPPLELDTVSHEISLNRDTVLQSERFGTAFLRSGMHGVARLFRDLLAMRAMCDPGDIDHHVDDNLIHIFDLYPGGIGYSELGHELHLSMMSDVLEAVTECPCAAGCPACVLPGASRIESALEAEVLEYPFPKEATRWLLHLLLGKESYEPQLEGIPAPCENPMIPVPPLLDARVERKIRKVARLTSRRGRQR